MDKLTGEWKNVYNGKQKKYTITPNAGDPAADNLTPLHILVARSVDDDVNKSGVIIFLEGALAVDGININVEDAKGKTPLYWAVEVGSFDAFDLLLKKGANINILDIDDRDGLGYSSLLDASLYNILRDISTTGKILPDRLKILQRLLEITNQEERDRTLKKHYKEVPEEVKKIIKPYLADDSKKWKLAELKMQFASFVKERLINNRLTAIKDVMNMVREKMDYLPLNIDIFDTNQLEVQSQALQDEYIAFLDRIIGEFNRMPKPNKSNVGVGPTFDEFDAAIQDILQFISRNTEKYPSTDQRIKSLPPTEDNFNLYLGQVLHLMNGQFIFNNFGISLNINLRDFFENAGDYIIIEQTRMRQLFTSALDKIKGKLIEKLNTRKRERDAAAEAERRMEEVRRANAARIEAEKEAAIKREAARIAKAKEEADKKAAKNAKNAEDRRAAQEKARINAEERDRLAKEAKAAKAEADRKASEEAEKIRIAKEALQRAEELRKARVAEAERLAKEEAGRVAREEQERLGREAAERVAREEQERLGREEAERIAREEEAARIAREKAENAAKKAKKAAENATLKAVNEQLQIPYNIEGEHIEALLGLRELIQGQFDAYNKYERTKNREAAESLKEINDLENQLNERLRQFRGMRVDCFDLNNSIARLYKQQQTDQTTLWERGLNPALPLKQKIIYKEKNLKYRDHLINLVTEFLNKAAVCYGINVEYWRKILAKDTKAREIEQADLQALKRQSPDSLVNPVPKPNERLRDVVTLINELLAEIGKRNELDTLQKKTVLENRILEILRRRQTLDAGLLLDELYMQILEHLNELENLQDQIVSLLNRQKNAENFKALPKPAQLLRKKQNMRRSAEEYFAKINGTTIEEPKVVKPRDEDVVPPPPPPPPVPRRPFSEIRSELEETNDPYRAVELINEAFPTHLNNINDKDKEGHTLLMFMVVKKFSRAVKRLLDLGADANIQDKQTGFTPLMMSIIVVNPNNIFESGTLITITNLIEKSDINVLDKNGYDAYHFAEELEKRIIPRNEKETFTQKVLNVLYAKRSLAPVRGIRSLFRGLFGGTIKNRKHADKKSLKRHRSK
jgi:ankyrin repeat protein